MPKKLRMALAIAAPTMPSTIFISNPISLFMNCSASQPAIPPMIMAAIQPICGSPMARLLRRGCSPAPNSQLSDVSGQLTRAALPAEVKASRDELRQDRNEWRGRAERLLTDQRRAWWRRITGWPMNSICGGAPLKACPARQIVANAGVEGSVVVGKILENKSQTFGFDAQT